jgi:hypothetical protein
MNTDPVVALRAWWSRLDRGWKASLLGLSLLVAGSLV